MAEPDLRHIVEAVYSAKGGDVLGDLLEKLVQTLPVDYAMISQLIGSQTSAARTRCFFADGERAPDFEYNLLGGPCEKVHGRSACIFNESVQRIFPDDLGLRKKDIESYIGIPLFAAGDDPIGIIAVMNRTPFDAPERVCDLLKIFASRIASELDWERRESALRQSESRFRNLVERSIQGIYIHRDMRLLFVNPAFAEMLGYDSPEELMSDRSLLRLIHPDEHERVLGFKNRRMAGQDAPSRYEIRLLRRDGSVVWLENNAYLIEWDGTPAIQSTNLDITERKRTEERLHSILENVSDGIFRTSMDGKLLWANTGLARMAGFDSGAEMVAEISDVASQIYVDPRDRTSLMRQLSEQGYVRDFVAPFRSAKTDETLWCSTNCKLSPGLDGRIYIDGVVRDITESRHNEERLRRVEKMQAIGQLTGGIAHDFNNLLGIMIGNLDMLQEDAANDEKLGRPIATALRAALRGAELTKRLLAFSRESQDIAKPWNINELIGQSRALLTNLLTAGIELQIVPGDGLWLAEVNEGDFEDVIVNLMSNACDAMPRGGHLTIETGNLTLLATDRGEMDDIPPGDYVLLRVSDDGFGMSKAVAEQMFEPFFTTKPVGRGTGLGMSLVYGFVRRAGGFIRVESQPGAGTTVRIFLPRAESAAGDSAFAEEYNLADQRGSEIVLVVDDEVDVVTLAQATLERLGYRVLVAQDADEALAQLAREPHADVLFTDVIMPGTMSGLDLAEHASERYPDLKVLLASGFSDKVAPLDRHSRFLDSLLAKPYRQSEMVRRIRSLLDQQAKAAPDAE